MRSRSSSSASALSGMVDVDLGLDDRHEPGVDDLRGGLELLVDDGGDAARIGRLDDGAHLRTEHTEADGTVEQVAEAGNRLHQLRAVDDVGEALVDLEERHHVLDRPQVLGGPEPTDLAIHGLLEEDRTEHVVAGERRGHDDAGAHRMHEIEHLVVGRPGIVDDPYKASALGVLPPL